ncbi:beta-1,4-N-acetylgalactosaminyltransferase bre-4-like [Mya arenaria]|uniref:beta-1,4-N-acetylgalactosaminyltransferase bre-4-like n=1 Tax=Mya arenaria TaxID=6604 RepID=UPI0022E8D081|nr:beta-1,4-N-acetylgalactosaminyltransferase bre-4-like [Mya arenaria]
MVRRCTRFTSVVVFLVGCAALVSVINVRELSVTLKTKLRVAKLSFGAASGLNNEKRTCDPRSRNERNGRICNDKPPNVIRGLTYKSRGNVSLELCQAVPDLLVGRLIINFVAALKSPPPPALQDVSPGGTWSPKNCVATQRIAIIIPFRDRQKHLDILAYYLVPVLKRQEVAFRIFVVEQYGNKTFNKGRLMNIGFTEARKYDEFDCFIFHDVDLIPEDDRNMYTCLENPRHMSPAVDKFKYKLPYKGLVGGVLSFRSKHFIKVNGYSNLFWGWGGEDDDMYHRLIASKITILRTPFETGRYKMIKHGRKGGTSPFRWKLLKTLKKRLKKDGLNTLEYKLVETRLEKLYTRILADVGDPANDSDRLSTLLA